MRDLFAKYVSALKPNHRVSGGNSTARIIFFGCDQNNSNRGEDSHLRDETPTEWSACLGLHGINQPEGNENRNERFYLLHLHVEIFMPCKCAGTSFFIVVVVVLSHVQILTYVRDELCTTIDSCFFIFWFIPQEASMLIFKYV